MEKEIDLDYKHTKTLRELLAEGVPMSAGARQLALDEAVNLGWSTGEVETASPPKTSSS